MFLVICRRCQLSVSGGRERLPLACHRHAHSQHALAQLCSLSLARSLSCSVFIVPFRCLSRQFALCNCLAQGFFVLCKLLQHLLNASWSSQSKAVKNSICSLFLSVRGLALASLSLLPPLALDVCKVCSAFVKMAASVRAFWGGLTKRNSVEWNANVL